MYTFQTIKELIKKVKMKYRLQATFHCSRTNKLQEKIDLKKLQIQVH